MDAPLGLKKPSPTSFLEDMLSTWAWVNLYNRQPFSKSPLLDVEISLSVFSWGSGALGILSKGRFISTPVSSKAVLEHPNH